MTETTETTTEAPAPSVPLSMDEAVAGYSEAREEAEDVEAFDAGEEPEPEQEASPDGEEDAEADPEAAEDGEEQEDDALAVTLPDGSEARLAAEALVEMPDGNRLTVQELQAGYFRQRDYTIKTTELAQQRRQYEGLLGALGSLEGLPVEHRQALAAEQQRIAGEHQAAADEHQAAFRADLGVVFPEWGSSPEQMARDTAAMAEVAQAYGFDPGEIAGVPDARLWMLLRDATKYRQIRENAAGAKAGKRGQVDGERPVRVLKASGPRPSPRTATASKVKTLRQKAFKTGTLEDVYAAYKASRRAGT